MRKRPVSIFAATLMAAGLTLGAPAAAQAAGGGAVRANAVNACGYNSSIGWHCGYYNGSAETDEWSTDTAAVKEIQDLINQETLYWENGHAQLAVDGSFGPDTLAAVEWLQATYGICGGVNGDVGPCTWSWLRWQ